MIGIISDGGVFDSSSGVFSPGGVFSRGGVFDVPATPPDPLIGIPFALRLQTHRGDGAPFGINPVNLGSNPLWSGLVSSASEPVTTKQPTTIFDGGIPALRFDGVDDQMLTVLQSSVFDSQGFFSILMRYEPGVDAATPIGGSAAGRAISSFDAGINFGLGMPGAAYPVAILSVSINEWTVITVSWNGLAVKTTVIDSGGTRTNTGSLPFAGASAPGVMGLGVHRTNEPYSWFRGDLIAATAGTSSLTDEQISLLSTTLFGLAPPP